MKQRFTMIIAVYIILRKNKKLLLMRRAVTGYFDGHYSLPAGHVDGNEPLHVAAIREAQEEIGVSIDPSDLSLLHTLHRKSDDEPGVERMDVFFEASKWQGEPQNMEPLKCDDLQWIAVDDLPKDMVPVTRFALERIAEGKPYSHFNFS